MNHTIREQRILKVTIGRDYYPSPVLRQMPKHWTLEETRRPEPRWWQDGGVWVGIVTVMAFVFAVVQTARAWQWL